MEMAQEKDDNSAQSTVGASVPLRLPTGTRLGEFEIVDVIGEGGFSIVYLAHDHQLQRTVAIKEYLPGAIAHRNAQGMVVPRFAKYEGTFTTGLHSFLKEARILAQFEHPSLIRIHRFWEQNGTAYMVMQYCQGRTMRQVLQCEPALGTDVPWLKHVMGPVLEALQLLHSRHCYHRDISPDNIMILDTGAPMLLDFGAARQVIGDMTQALTVILKPGFAPIEQYADDESMKQGPWTDIYGVGAVLYFAVTGKAPTASVARLVKDPLKKLSGMHPLPVSAGFAWMIDRALAVFPNERPQSVDEFVQELLDHESSTNLSGAVAEVAMSVVDSGSDGFVQTQRRELSKTKAVVEPEVAPRSAVTETPSSHRTQTTVAQDGGWPHDVTAGQSTFKWRRTFASRRKRVIFGAFVVGMGAMALLVHLWSVRDESVPSVVVVSGSAQQIETARAGEVRDEDTGKGEHRDAQPPTPSPAASEAMNTASESVRNESPTAAAVIPERTASDSAQGARVPPPNPPKPRASQDASPSPPAAPRATLPSVRQDDAKPRTGGRDDAKSQSDDSGKNTPDASKPADPKSAVKPPGAFVRLSLKPWGKVVIDGVDKGSSPPLTQVWLSEGEHSIVIENSEFQNHTETIRITDKKDVTVVHRFGP